MTLEFWNTVFQWGAVGLVALTFVFVAGAVWTGNLITERQAQQLEAMEGEFSRLQSSFGQQQARTGGATTAPSAAAPRAPRTLDAAARARLLDALRQVRPEGPLEIRFVSGGTTEPAAFARALADVVEAAGWPLGDGSSGTPTGEPPIGVLIRVGERGPVPARAEALDNALRQAGVDARIERLSTVGDGAVELMIGLQPEP